MDTIEAIAAARAAGLTPERARQVLSETRQGARLWGPRKGREPYPATDAERVEYRAIADLWSTMAGSTSWSDALCRLTRHEVTWRIDWHEGDRLLGYAGRTFETVAAFEDALRRIGSEESLKRGGYNKAGVTMLVDGVEEWSDRVDCNVYSGEIMRPLAIFERYAAFYATPRGIQYLAACYDDADHATMASERVAGYQRLAAIVRESIDLDARREVSRAIGDLPGGVR